VASDSFPAVSEVDAPWPFQTLERYRQGTEDQLGALGLVLNATVLWITIYMDKARARRQVAGRPISPTRSSRG
jgi:hypothetical protein